MPSSATTRQVRAVALASASFGLGLAGHLQAGGHATSPIGLALAAGFCALSGWSYSRRSLSGPGLVAVLLGNQVVMHFALAMSSTMSSADMTAMSGDRMTGHTGQSMSADTGQSMSSAAASADTGPAAMTMQLVPGGWMILAHLAATLLTAGVLLAVQTLCLGFTVLARWLARVIRAAFGTPLVLTHSGGAAWAAPRSWTSRSIGARPGRGPPLLHIAR
jgi:hypothetical protein